MRRREFISVIAGAAVWPLGARAQQPVTRPVIGFLGPARAAEAPPHLIAAFRRGLAEAGYVEGKNLAIEYRFTNFRPGLMIEVAGDLVRLNMNVIFASTPDAVVAVRNATTSIPVVALDLESDPLAKGYVKSLARPGGNMTGMFLDIPELSGKQVGLLKEIVPRLSRIAIFGIPDLNAPQFAATEIAARALALEAEIMEVRVRMTSSAPWRPPEQSMLKVASCYRPPLYLTFRSKSPSLRWPNGSPSLACSGNFQKLAVS
jgi:putative tryptophan/tyrosine transport system substrate-binding protein